MLVAGLVDTGADRTLLPLEVAEVLNVQLTPCTGPSPVGFGSADVTTFSGTVAMQITGGENEYDWQTPVLFHAGDANTVILGHQGFLEFFSARFDGGTSMLTLEANE